MPKLKPARLSGLYGMETYTAEELYAKADWYEAQISNPENTDDSKYLMRWAKRIRKLAMQKEKAHEQKCKERSLYKVGLSSAKLNIIFRLNISFQKLNDNLRD